MNKKKLLVSLLAVIVIGAGLYGLSLPAKNNPQGSKSNIAVKGEQTIKYEGRDGVDVLTLLKENAKVEAQDFGEDLGAFVTSVNDVASTTDHFWFYYVNGKEGEISASKYITKTGDKIEWKFEEMKY